MKKIIKIENLDCANCASKIEEQIKKINEINNVSVSFMSQKIFIEIDDAKNYENIFNKIKKEAKKIEPDIIFK